MSELKRLGVQDALWLEMDRPNNLMVVDSLIWTAEPLDWDSVREVLRDRIWDRYPVFRSIATQDDDGAWCWEEDHDFSLEDRIEMVELDDHRDASELQHLVADHRTRMLDREQPLWQAFFIDRYLGGSAILVRTHHAVADGMRMVQLSMTLFDLTADGGEVPGPGVTQYGEHPAEPGGSAADRVRSGLANLGRGATGTARWMVDLGQRVTGLAPEAAGGAVDLIRTAPTNPVGAVHGFLAGTLDGLGRAVDSVRSSLDAAAPGSGPIVDLFSAAPGDLDSTRKLLVGTRNDVAMWTGTAGVEKAVAWSEPLSLEQVKRIAKAHNATVNDVLMTCVAGALHQYLEAHGEHCASAAFMIPVNLTPIDLSLPDDLGNGFALVQLELPTDQADLLHVLDITKRRMNRIKHGHEAAIAFRLQETISGLNRSVYEASVDLLANRTVGSMTNVPGPPVPVYLAGQRVEGMIGFAPVSGDQPMSFTIYSYDGRVTVGIACDSELMPDHEILVKGFASAFEQLQSHSTTAS